MLFEQIIFTHLRITHIVGQPGPEVISFTLCVAKLFVKLISSAGENASFSVQLDSQVLNGGLLLPYEPLFFIELELEEAI